MSDKTAKLRVVKDIRPVVSAFSVAAGFMRGISIKQFAPKYRRREFDVLERNKDSRRTRCQLFREKGAGNVPTIVLGGFVPDATETVEFQRTLLRRHGSIYYLNYSRNGFCQEMFAAQLNDLIEDLARRGQKPLIMAISFGCGLLATFMRNAEERVHESVRGLVLVSPVITTDDLIRPLEHKRDGVRMLESNLKKIVAADPADESNISKHIERSRRCFQALFNAGAENRILSVRHLAIRKKINDVIEYTTARGGFERVKALRDFRFPLLARTLFSGPVLVLLAENEADIMVSSSPTLKLFSEASLYTRIFPSCRVKRVRSHSAGDGVAHASLIFHHEAYNELLESWYEKLLYPRLKLAV
ncbi:MAG: alpha/beta hydrolase [Desulfuromonadaceae bacterium]|nr:alpha/beta hydrolase [Desulfuromonadaceae bacterium]MDD2848899.1 alpha/beta hydrolase [Desulfuromonadaceae bacterium]MDD4132144.1 alpha/beta hydrolase [Desulfuromonadaceae bacterium]